MLICRSKRTAAAVLLLSAFATPAFAVNKDMVQLQTQIQQLQEAIARLQQSNDERMGVLKDLVQQNADTVNRMSVNMDALQKQMVAQQTAAGGKVDQVSGQVQALNDSLDEMRARMARLEKLLGDVQGQTQSIGAALQNLPANPGASTAAVPSASGPAAAPASAPAASSREPVPAPGFKAAPGSKPSAAIPESAPTAIAPAPRRAADSANAAPVKDLYKSAYGDYMAAKYGLATSEFNEIIKAYPDDTLAGNAFYYLGEMEYRQAKYSAAAKDYDRVLEQFPDNNKIPAAHLHKGQALIEMKQTDAGVRELRALIQRFPSSPEATQARSRLNTLGVPVKPKA